MSKSNYKYKVYNGKAFKEMMENSRILIFAVAKNNVPKDFSEWKKQKISTPPSWTCSQFS